MSKTVFGSDEEIVNDAREHIVMMLQKEHYMYDRQVKRLNDPTLERRPNFNADWVRASTIYMREFERAIKLVSGDDK